MSREKGSLKGDYTTVVRDHGVLTETTSTRKTPWLELVQGPGAPRQYVLHAAETVLGRSHQAGICIESGLLSRRHAMVQRSGTESKLVDLDSANGVFVNGIRIHSVVLCEGDAIQIGDVALVFREGG